MPSVHACELPPAALLARLRRADAYTDCYTTEVARPVAHAEFVAAFYTTWLFKLERMLLARFAARSSTDAEARQLADGARDRFAAWSVEARADDQILLTDFTGRTRSWLMVATVTGGTRLYFGSAVVPVRGPRTRRSSMGFGFHVLLGFHKLYSRALLAAARSRLTR